MQSQVFAQVLGGVSATLKSVIDAHSILSITDVRGLIVYANEKFCEISGYKEEELLGQSHRIINSGEHSRAFFEDMWRTITRGLIWHGEVKNRHKSGSFYWVSSTIVPVENEYGFITHYLSIRTDITQVKVQAERLDILNRQVELVVRQSGAMIVAHDSNNDRFRLLLGRAKLLETHINLPATEFQRKVHTAAEISELEGAKASPGRSVVAAVRNPRTGEPLAWYQFGYSESISSTEGDYQLLYAVPVTDIVRLQDLLKAALKFANIALYEENTHDGSGRFIHRPRNQDEYVPLVSWLQQVLEPYRETVSSGLSEVGKRVEYQVRFSPEAEPEWLEQATIARFDDSTLGMSRNIDREKRIQEQLEEQNRELAGVADRNRRMFAIIGHEIKTPLLGASMMLSEDFENKGAEYMQQVKESVDHALELIEQLREMIQPELMLKKRALRPLDLVQATKGIITSQEATFGGVLDIRLQVGWLPEPILEVNATSFRQVLLNLIRNSAIHAKPRHIWITIYANEVIGQAGQYQVTLVVADDGPGVPAEKQQSIFEAFSQGNESSVGTGIGLYVCRDSAQSMRGDLIYRDRPEGGAQFFFTFVGNTAGSHASKPAANSDVGSLEGKRVLFAEDTITLRLLTEQMLKKAGAVVTSVEDGQAALEAAAKDSFDLMITDFYMPNISGPELTLELRSQGIKCPIFALTAALSEHELETLRQAGVTAVLDKPLNIPELLKFL